MARESLPRALVQAPPCLEGVTVAWVACHRDSDAVVCWIDVMSPTVDRTVSLRRTSYVRFGQAGSTEIRPVRDARVLPLVADETLRVAVTFDDVPPTPTVTAVLDMGCAEIVFDACPVE